MNVIINLEATPSDEGSVVDRATLHIDGKEFGFTNEVVGGIFFFGQTIGMMKALSVVKLEFYFVEVPDGVLDSVYEFRSVQTIRPILRECCIMLMGFLNPGKPFRK